jgi:hypothetical protein
MMQTAASATHRVTVQPPPPLKCRCVIKLGGSAITVKDQHQTLRPDVLKSVCATISGLVSCEGEAACDAGQRHSPCAGACRILHASSPTHQLPT